MSQETCRCLVAFAWAQEIRIISTPAYSTGRVQFSNATGDQVEVGTKGSFLNEHATATLAAYRVVKKHLLAQQTLTSPIEQVGQRSSEGIEASLSLNVTPAFGIEANGRVLRARFDSFISGSRDYAGKVRPNVPWQSANPWLRWTPLRQLQMRAGLRYVGQTYSDNANLFRIPGLCHGGWHAVLGLHPASDG